LSTAVEKVSDFAEGIVVFLGIIAVLTQPKVSIPRVKGVTSSKSTSLTSHCMIPA
jgi:hypothetical protein